MSVTARRQEAAEALQHRSAAGTRGPASVTQPEDVAAREHRELEHDETGTNTDELVIESDPSTSGTCVTITAAGLTD